jgi:hypothetical protein
MEKGAGEGEGKVLEAAEGRSHRREAHLGGCHQREGYLENNSILGHVGPGLNPWRNAGKD